MKGVRMKKREGVRDNKLQCTMFEIWDESAGWSKACKGGGQKIYEQQRRDDRMGEKNQGLLGPCKTKGKKMKTKMDGV